MSIRKILKNFALSTGRANHLVRRFCKPDGREWSDYLRRWGGLASIGCAVHINDDFTITQPAYVSIGSKVTLSSCVLLGPDGVIRILENRFGEKLDSVGEILIRDNCFIGHGAILMPRLTIEPNALAAAGTVVTKDVPPCSVVGGNPAKFSCSIDDLVRRLETRSEGYPWMPIVRARRGSYDPSVEAALVAEQAKNLFAGSR